MIISRSKDCMYCGNGHSNLCFTVYDDGWYCYSCHRGSRKSEEHWVHRPRSLETTKKQFHIPPNTTDINRFSPHVLSWLYSYYVYDPLILDSRIAYSPATENYPESVILPVAFDAQDNVIEYQRRFFPKAFFSSSGVKKEIFVRGTGTTLIIVEDYISCLRISQQTGCSLCLFGTSLSPSHTSYVIHNYTDVCIWLDDDEPGRTASYKIAKQLEKEFKINSKLKPMLYKNDISINEIKTAHSAKDFSDAEIKNIISPTGDGCWNSDSSSSAYT